MNINKNNSEKSSYIKEGPILSSLMKLSLPIMLGKFMQTLYNLADTFWVGRVGADAVAAISISFLILFLLIRSDFHDYFSDWIWYDDSGCIRNS